MGQLVSRPRRALRAGARARASGIALALAMRPPKMWVISPPSLNGEVHVKTLTPAHSRRMWFYERRQLTVTLVDTDRTQTTD